MMATNPTSRDVEDFRRVLIQRTIADLTAQRDAMVRKPKAIRFLYRRLIRTLDGEIAAWTRLLFLQT